jgi:hypothetical protein
MESRTGRVVIGSASRSPPPLRSSKRAEAQVTIDITKITCNEFVTGQLTDSNTLSVWLNGYVKRRGLDVGRARGAPESRRATVYRDSQRWRRNLGRCEF